MNHMGHPIASNVRDCYNALCKTGTQNEIPLMAGGGIGKSGNLAANAAALIMLGASMVQTGKYVMQAAAGCVGSEADRCNVCNIGVCPKGITSQDPRIYRRLDPEKVAERVVDFYLSFDTELKKIVAPLGRSTSLPIGMSDALASATRPLPNASASSTWSNGTKPSGHRSESMADTIKIQGHDNGHRVETRILEERIQQAVREGARNLEIDAMGQHGIGGRLWVSKEEPITIKVTGAPGQRLGSKGFLGTTIEVMGPASDDVGWLNAGAEIIVHGHGSNGACNAMAQGKVLIAGNIARAA